MRSRARGLLAVLALASVFGVLSVLVHAHVTDGIDLWVWHHLYPHQHWGLPQVVSDVLVEALQPAVTALVYVALAWHRARAAVLGALLRVAVVTASVTFLKWFFDRPDVHGNTEHLGGSYPSGHMAALVAYGAPWWLAAPLGVALLVTGTHWLTDVVAGVLIGGVLRGAFVLRRRVGEPPAERVLRSHT
jgi:membrane-associated phospholipid phosphatase